MVGGLCVTEVKKLVCVVSVVNFGTRLVVASLGEG